MAMTSAADAELPGAIELDKVVRDGTVVCPDCAGPTVMTGTRAERSMGSWEILVDVVCPSDGTAFGIKTWAEGIRVGMVAERA